MTLSDMSDNGFAGWFKWANNAGDNFHKFREEDIEWADKTSALLEKLDFNMSATILNGTRESGKWTQQIHISGSHKLWSSSYVNIRLWSLASREISVSFYISGNTNLSKRLRVFGVETRTQVYSNITNRGKLDAFTNLLETAIMAYESIY